MNKLILLVLAICLISAHAFVKRETEAVTPNNSQFTEIQNQFQTVVKLIQEKAAEAFDPDVIKKNVQSIVDTFEKTVNDLKANSEKKE